MQSLWMLLACAMFAMMGAFVKVAADLGATLPEIVLFRGIPSVLLLFFWARSTRRTIRPSSWRLHVWRNISGIASMWLGFFALSHLALPTAISLNYTAPLFIAGWLLFFGGAQRDPVRVLAVLAGFLGVLGILRPSVEHDQWLAALMGLGAGGLAAIAMMQIRQLGQIGEPEWRTVLLFSIGVCISGVVGIGAQGWRTSDPLALLALTGLGLAGLVGQLTMTRAFGLGSTLLTAALQYTTIIFAALIGILFWGDRPAPLAWAGMALIIGSGLLSVWRTHMESRTLRGSSRPPAGAPQTKEVNPS
ncbi:DMT family transporter [uncultured Castellaniella sp.]|jgi:S-adenosylmethionine uptake transporter|uniref:DMT family transporter n=1 Tax=uncultured Castellaniella sp. TaxID=647907 RepID=UPI0026063A91|nr:DMT family transporter [uncultured Castellaniella sp.]